MTVSSHGVAGAVSRPQVKAGSTTAQRGMYGALSRLSKLRSLSLCPIV